MSRVHAAVEPFEGRWRLRDLNSSNGTFVGGERVGEVNLDGRTPVRFGVRGPEVVFSAVPVPVVAAPVPAPQQVFSHSLPQTAKKDASHYFGPLAEGETAGEHTMFIRSAFAQVQRKQKRKYGSTIVLLTLLMAGLGFFGYRQYQKANRQRQVAEQVFYSIKGLDLDIAALEQTVSTSNNQGARVQMQGIQDRRKQMEENYNRFLASLHIYDPSLSEQDRLIMRVARIFGECEIDMPKDFRKEVGRYIKYWQSSNRLSQAIHLANQNGYTQHIAQELMKQDLPPQYFYLALQESDFNQSASGPATTSGIAKGMWQFEPQTAAKYGLKLGPLVDDPRPDVMDDRDHYDRETVAAGKYIKDMYSTDAQASGLLVLACYNWSQPQVLHLVRSMPPNPRDRNFWQLLQKYRNHVPDETYDYVFKIFSAAVIGENPKLFGFDFDNPLAPQSASLVAPHVRRRTPPGYTLTMKLLADHHSRTAHDDRVGGAEGETGLLDHDIAHAAGHHAVDKDGEAAHQDGADTIRAGDADHGAGMLIDLGTPGGQATDQDVHAAGSGRERGTVGGWIGDACCWRHGVAPDVS